MTWEELVAGIPARDPGRGCRGGAGYWKDSELTVKLTDEAAREQALAIPGAELFDPGMGRVMREWVLVPAAKSGGWKRLRRAGGGRKGGSGRPPPPPPGARE